MSAYATLLSSTLVNESDSKCEILLCFGNSVKSVLGGALLQPESGVLGCQVITCKEALIKSILWHMENNCECKSSQNKHFVVLCLSSLLRSAHGLYFATLL